MYFFLQEARVNRMQELQNHLEKISREKMSLELKVTELSTFQNEVVSLRNEITTLKVIIII